MRIKKDDKCQGLRESRARETPAPEAPGAGDAVLLRVDGHEMLELGPVGVEHRDPFGRY